MAVTSRSAGDEQHLQDYMERAQEAVRALQEVRARIDAVTGQGVGADGLVRAVCDGRGGISEAWFDPRAMRQDHVTLGRTVTAVLQAAQQDAERQTLAITGEALDGVEALPEPPDERVVRDQIERVAHEILEA
ncbi:YbaB/EbfC family nucleoid-associated protein [Streptosporangium canum]|uniref:YbaB/EbfC family nucleoid-associated protein n=1 Tax=Streptosporangium canum TaxID=324952 RepID=UPI0033AE30FD